MDDYSVTSLTESKNEWCARLVNVMTPAVINGLRSIFDEAWQLCVQEDEEEQYLKTFQTFLSRVPKWNSEIIETERKRICEVSSCGYLEDLITCVHIIQLKALTCIRVGQDQKKIDLQVPSVDSFVHKAYVNVARKVYTNVYLFEKDIAPLQIQKHNRELEVIIKECIMNSIRDSMPVEDILKSYLAETTEEEVTTTEEIIEKPAPEPVVEEVKAENKDDVKEKSSSDDAGSNNSSGSGSNNERPTEPVITIDTFDDVANETQDTASDNTPTAPKPPVSSPVVATDKVSFTDTDKAVDGSGVETSVNAPKDVARLEQISKEAHARRKAEEAEDDEDDDGPLSIGEEVRLEIADIHDINKKIEVKPAPALDIQTLV